MNKTDVIQHPLLINLSKTWYSLVEDGME